MSVAMQRQSIRRFKEDKVPKEKITALLQAAMQAPSANNQQPWDFIVVEDKETLVTLSKASNGAWMLDHAPLAIVPVLRSGDRSPRLAVQDISAATQNILLEATQQDLGGVWIGVYPLEERIEYIRNVLDIPIEVNPFCMIALGYPNESKELKLRYDESRIYYNKWGNQ